MQLVGRSSSLFTRVASIVAHEAGAQLELEVVRDMTALDAIAYAGNPALKLPTLRRDTGDVVFGTLNIARILGGSRIVWPEDVRSDRGRNGQELVDHAMAAQVQLVMGTVIGKLPADNVYFAKGRAGFEGALRWLDDNVDAVIAEATDLSWFAIELFCLIEHLAFRATVDTAPYPSLARFATSWGQRASARATTYRYDA